MMPFECANSTASQTLRKCSSRFSSRCSASSGSPASSARRVSSSRPWRSVPADELHCVAERAVLGRLEPVDRDDVRVVELRGHLHLGDEARHRLGARCHLGQDRLERDLAAEVDVARDGHGAHRALAELGDRLEPRRRPRAPRAGGRRGARAGWTRAARDRRDESGWVRRGGRSRRRPSRGAPSGWRCRRAPRFRGMRRNPSRLASAPASARYAS